MKLAVEHILWGAPDLDAGSRVFEELTGIAPIPVGSHAGVGTRNRLVPLGAGIYFEIIAPDPQQAGTGPRRKLIEGLSEPRIIAFAVTAMDLIAVQNAAVAAGLAYDGPTSMSRIRPDGVRLEWATLYLRHPLYDGALPFAIDWRGSPHPSSAPNAGSLRSFTVQHPDSEPLTRLYERLGIAAAVEPGPSPGFVAVLGTPKGDITLR